MSKTRNLRNILSLCFWLQVTLTLAISQTRIDPSTQAQNSHFSNTAELALQKPTSRNARQAAFSPSLTQASCAGDGVTDDTSCLQNAANAGGTIKLPAGYYRITQTITMTLPGTAFMGESQDATYILKGANVDAISIQCSRCGLESLSIIGAFQNDHVYSQWPHSLAAPSYADTTNGVIVGVAGSTYPDEWRLREVRLGNHGKDGLDWEDGPFGMLDHVLANNNGQWGIYTPIAKIAGGVAFDNSHGEWLSVLAYSNGSGTFADGGNIYLGGTAHHASLLKSFAGLGSGIVIASINSKLDIFSELDAGHNSYDPSTNFFGVRNWTTGATYSVGSLVLANGSLYQAKTTGLSGATLPSCLTATCSDGAITWQFRATYGIYFSLDDIYNTNEVSILFTQDASPGYGMQSSGSRRSLVPGYKNVIVGNYMNGPQLTITDAFSGTGNYMNAFKAAGFVGYEAAMINGGQRRNWFGVHSPLGAQEGFIGTPDTLPLAFYTNGNRAGSITATGQWDVHNLSSGGYSQLSIEPGSSQAYYPFINVYSQQTGRNLFQVGYDGSVQTIGGYSFQNGNYASDAGLSRCAASTVCVGDGTLGNSSGSLRAATVITSQTTPGSSKNPCTVGAIWADSNFLYVCTANSVIKRSALTTF